MPATYEPIASTTLGAAAADVTFSSIPGTYTDLVIVLWANTSSLQDTNIRFNSDQTSLYSVTRLYGTGSGSGASDRQSGQTQIRIGDVSTGAATLTIINVMNYSNTTTNKTILVRSNKSDSILFANVGLYRSTSAISSLVMFPTSGTWSSGSTFTIYGIKAA